jgi:hypothetical protein
MVYLKTAKSFSPSNELLSISEFVWWAKQIQCLIGMNTLIERGAFQSYWCFGS